MATLPTPDNAARSSVALLQAQANALRAQMNAKRVEANCLREHADANFSILATPVDEENQSTNVDRLLSEASVLEARAVAVDAEIAVLLLQHESSTAVSPVEHRGLERPPAALGRGAPSHQDHVAEDTRNEISVPQLPADDLRSKFLALQNLPRRKDLSQASRQLANSLGFSLKQVAGTSIPLYNLTCHVSGERWWFVV